MSCDVGGKGWCHVMWVGRLVSCDVGGKGWSCDMWVGRVGVM